MASATFDSSKLMQARNRPVSFPEIGTSRYLSLALPFARFDAAVPGPFLLRCALVLASFTAYLFAPKVALNVQFTSKNDELTLF